MSSEHVSNEDILDAMTSYGGGFVTQLAALFRVADNVNRGRIMQAFPDIWEKYAELVRLRRQRGANV